MSNANLSVKLPLTAKVIDVMNLSEMGGRGVSFIAFACILGLVKNQILRLYKNQILNVFLTLRRRFQLVRRLVTRLTG